MDIQRKEPIALGPTYYLDVENELLIKNGLRVGLSRIQFRLLYYLAQHIGQPVSDQDLIDYAWGAEAFISRNYLYVTINRLRSKIEDNLKNPELLLSLRGVGYILYPIRKNNL